MKRTLAALALLTATAGCATAPAPAPKAACVRKAPPAVGSRKLEFLAPPKVIDSEKDVAALIVRGRSFLEFTDWLQEITTWADGAYEACKDPAAPSAPPVWPLPKQQDEDE